MIPPELQRVWTWGNEPNVETGVHTFENCLTWYRQVTPDWAGSAARQQTFEEFLKEGAPVDAPQDIVESVRVFLEEAHQKGLWH